MPTRTQVLAALHALHSRPFAVLEFVACPYRCPDALGNCDEYPTPLNRKCGKTVMETVFYTKDEYEAEWRRDRPWCGPQGQTAYYLDEESEALHDGWYEQRIAVRALVREYNSTHAVSQHIALP